MFEQSRKVRPESRVDGPKKIWLAPEGSTAGLRRTAIELERRTGAQPRAPAPNGSGAPHTAPAALRQPESLSRLVLRWYQKGEEDPAQTGSRGSSQGSP